METTGGRVSETVGNQEARGRGAGQRRGKRSPAEIRRSLLDAATHLFAARGFDGVNTNEIAREARVGVGTFYLHFEDKFQIHQGVVLDTLEALRDEIARSAASPGGDVRTQVRDLVEAVVSFAQAGPDRFRVAFCTDAAQLRASRGASRGGAGNPPHRPQIGYSTRVTERRLADLQAGGLLDPAIDPAVAARAFVAMQNGVLCWWLEDRRRATRDGVIQTLVRLHPAVAGALPNK
jgi:AcrR family transcriptional regulator